MSRPHARGKNPLPPNKPRTVRISWDLTGFVAWMLARPRTVRFLIVGLFAISVTLAVFPIVDELYIRFLFDEATRILPSFVSTSLGIIMYVFGWRLIIGTIGEVPPVRPAVFWYLVIGILATLLVVALFLQGYSIGTAPG
jgi:hypothetical protein